MYLQNCDRATDVTFKKDNLCQGADLSRDKNKVIL